MDPAMLASVTIYNLPPAPPRWDSVGVFYISFCAAWTALVLAGMVFCWINRSSPILKLRGLPLSFTAISFLHIYWILAQITYTVGVTMPVVLAYDIQYFAMGTWFPLGIALFHASNSRFLHVAKLQKLHFTGRGDGSRRGRTGCDGAKTSWLCRFRNMDYSKRVMIFIGIGMVAQVLLTVGMWFACKKYHPTYGIPGTEIRGSNLMEQMEDLGRGWEWWPTVFWQVVWTWIVAPILLFRAIGIRDTMGWRTQTIGCCLSSLHGTPLFLVSSYVPQFAKINLYFPPSQWFHLSSMMFEVFTVFVPAFQVIRLKMLNKRAAAANAKWETASQTNALRPVSVLVSTCDSCKRATSATDAEKGYGTTYYNEAAELGPEPDSRLLTMGALDHALRENLGSLQDYSALRDFSGENIAFIGRVAAWKSSTTWPNLPEPSEVHSPKDGAMLEAYNGALDIYADFVSLNLAEFPLNLPSTEVKPLDAVFEKPAKTVFGDDESVNPVSPFEDTFPHQRGQPRSGRSGRDDDAAHARGQMRYAGEIPAGFDASVFDSAYKHIKYLVLTNTWPKYVKEMHQRRRSSETGRSVLTTESETSLLSRVSSRVSGLVRSVLLSPGHD
ncbi:hypothetical protein Cob_v001260 [Colletotrichum orbiculare MAFF 240422]|uniref:Uncharacterized protein n=1 Tax=Colletotrichum orbiculare (strain 104-T / ATCC 96160 / CBS 514.97 / LARS 414 / MAFF 240422) TaxID=1213857 RepID=N4VXH1_COLOR|nr:hypothetical protein Cob_v001260 [Colletotrichum orbiculare MAFF 240422]